MMNLLARILSHGFALAVVVLIAIALMYRGDLFPEWELPEFLVVEDKSGTVTEGTPATVDSTLPEAAATSPEATAGVPAEAPQVEVAGDVETQEVVSPAEEVVAGTADTLPETSPAAAIVDDTAGPETALEVPEVAVPDSTPETPVCRMRLMHLMSMMRPYPSSPGMATRVRQTKRRPFRQQLSPQARS
jgi:hypothetical protein